MNAILQYGTPIDQYVPNYGNRRLFSEDDKEIVSQLPKTIAIIRVVATLVLTVYLAVKFKATIFCWPVVVLGMAFAGWTTYSHLLSKDPLVEVFYKIVGGKDQFKRLPEIRLEQAPNQKIYTALEKLEWDKLDQPIYKATTRDGRNVFIVKGLNHANEGLFGARTRSILAFVEKVGPEDVPRHISNLPEIVEMALYAIYAPLKGNTFNRSLSSSQSLSILQNGDRIVDSCKTKICSSITTSMANEFFAQLTSLIPFIKNNV